MDKFWEILDWLGDRLNERSTWIGIIALLTIAGVNLDPAQTAAIISGGGAIGGLILIITKDKVHHAPPTQPPTQ